MCGGCWNPLSQSMKTHMYCNTMVHSGGTPQNPYFGGSPRGGHFGGPWGCHFGGIPGWMLHLAFGVSFGDAKMSLLGVQKSLILGGPFWVTFGGPWGGPWQNPQKRYIRGRKTAIFRSTFGGVLQNRHLRGSTPGLPATQLSEGLVGLILGGTPKMHFWSWMAPLVSCIMHQLFTLGCLENTLK